jgi:hypothetical protein
MVLLVAVYIEGTPEGQGSASMTHLLIRSGGERLEIPFVGSYIT